MLRHGIFLIIYYLNTPQNILKEKTLNFNSRRISSRKLLLQQIFYYAVRRMVIIILLSKAIVLSIILIPFKHQLDDFEILFLGPVSHNNTLELVIVMIILPLLFNIIQFKGFRTIFLKVNGIILILA